MVYFRLFVKVTNINLGKIITMKILLLEDDSILSKEIATFCINNAITCDYVHDGEEFQRKIQTSKYDLYILDINVPKINGLDTCKHIRNKDQTTPILMLTAFEALEDKIDAFDAGADDYLVKPFHFQELLARIKVLYKRSENSTANEQILAVDDLTMYVDKKKVMRAEEVIELTPKEFKLLHILLEAKGNILSKQEISEQLWDYHIETNINTIEVYINFLRKKIDVKHENKLIQTKIGFGYFIQ